MYEIDHVDNHVNVHVHVHVHCIVLCYISPVSTPLCVCVCVCGLYLCVTCCLPLSLHIVQSIAPCPALSGRVCTAKANVTSSGRGTGYTSTH